MDVVVKKPWYQSKTLWFNVFAGLGSIFAAGGALGHVLDPEEVGAVIGIGNIVLRLVTHKGLVF